MPGMKRAQDRPEFLDGPLDPATLRGNLRDLARINRWLGGVDLSRRAIRELAGAAWPQPTISVLDVGTGGADIPLDLLRTWGAWPALSVTALDLRPEVIDAARALRPELGRTPGLAVTVADGTTLPFEDRAFDIAHSSLVLHHLEPDAAVGFLREQARVARLGIVVNDLSRATVHWLGAVAIGRCCTGNAYTRNDGPLSVRRAYTLAELERLLHAAGLEPRRTARGILGHRYAVIARRSRPRRS
jgi:ubiquinone/menaquinone biosynthesis C-methylase UbiE